VGRLDEHAWLSAERTPPFYPDAVTLVPGVDAASILDGIDSGPGCSIKDSFGDLDLTAEGFEVLSRAEWLRLDAARSPVSATEWSSIETADELVKWETAWGATEPFFRPALLADESIAVLGRYDAGRIVAGAVANLSATAIGLSNVFDEGGDLESAYAAGATSARERWGPLPVVGYDSGAALEAAHRAGLVSVGELAVWLSAAD
jgi:hypothetical protein